MKQIIEKYETKLNFLNKAIEQNRYLMDDNTLNMMDNLKILLTEVITDFKAIKALDGGNK